MKHFAASITAVRWQAQVLQVVHEVKTIHLPDADLARQPNLAQMRAEAMAQRKWKEKQGFFDHRAQVLDLGEQLNGIGFKIVTL